jgi:hypothetical protein
MKNEKSKPQGFSGKVLNGLKYGVVLSGVLCASSQAMAAPLLNSDLATFAVLGDETVTNVPTSPIVGNVGVYSTGGANSITGFDNTTADNNSYTSPQITGTLEAGTATASTGQDGITTARTGLASLTGATVLGPNLTGLSLAPGLYQVSAAATNLDNYGTLTLDGGGNANAAWVFMMTSTLITGNYSNIDVVNVGTGDGVGIYWDVASSATLNTYSNFAGNILASTSVTVASNASIIGRSLAESGYVSLDMNMITISGISGSYSGGLDVQDDGSVVFLGAPVAAVPIPAALPFLITALFGLFLFRKKTSSVA